MNQDLKPIDTDCPLVSIIMPVRNGERYIAEAIKSCLQQTYSNIEVLIIDDGSSDRTIEIIRGFGIEPIINSSRRGANVSRNLGLRRAQGVYVKFMDSDDILLARAIEGQVKFAESLSENDIGYGRLLQFGEAAVNPHLGFYHPNVGASNLDDLLSNGIQTALPLHRLEHLLRVKGFDESIQIGQEWNMHARMASIGLRFRPDGTDILLYRAHIDPERVTVQHKFNSSFLAEKLNSLEATFSLRGTGGTEKSEMCYVAELFGLFTLAKEYKNYQVIYKVSEILRSHSKYFQREWLGRRYMAFYYFFGHDLFFRGMKRLVLLEERLSQKIALSLSLKNIFPARKT